MSKKLKLRQTGIGNVADCKLHYTKQFSILIFHTDALCQISGSWPVWFLRKMGQKFNHVKNILSRIKQEVDIWQIEKSTALHDTVVHIDALCQISGSWPVWFLRKM